MAEATSDLIGSKINDVVDNSYGGKLTNISKKSQQYNLETVKNEYNK